MFVGARDVVRAEFDEVHHDSLHLRHRCACPMRAVALAAASCNWKGPEKPDRVCLPNTVQDDEG